MALPPGRSSELHSRRHVAAPPDYSSRAVRWRLFVMVAVVLTAANVLSRFFDDDWWQALGWRERSFAGGPAITPAERFDGRWNDRLPPRPTAEPGPVLVRGTTLDPSAAARPTAIATTNGDPAPNSGATAAQPTTPAAPAEAKSAATENPAQTATWRDAWRSLLREISLADESRLYGRLRAARKRAPPLEPSADETLAWRQQIAGWEQAWASYLSTAQAALEPIPEAERAQWSQLLDDTADSWTFRWRPLLDSLGEPTLDDVPDDVQPATDDELIELLQEVADHRALDAIQDDTVWRATESNIWFHLIDELRRVTPEQLNEQSDGIVGYVPLFKQPAHHRGRVVTVRGVVHLAYRVDAPSNEYGVKEYTLLWIYPAGGPDSPLVVYALETPPGFPRVKHRDRDRGTSQLHEEVEVTGYFFKRWAYEGRDGIHVAPLLVAQSPRWQAADDGRSRGPSGGAVGAIILGSAIVGIGAALLVYYQTRRT